MVGTVVLNGVLGFAMTLTFVFVTQNVETQILDSTAAYPFVSVFEVAVGSKAGAVGMTAPVIILLIAAAINRYVFPRKTPLRLVEFKSSILAAWQQQVDKRGLLQGTKGCHFQVGSKRSFLSTARQRL